MLRGLFLVAAATAVIGANGSAAASQPSVAQLEAAISAQSDDFVLANAYGNGRARPGHGWIDLKTGVGRWVSANGKSVTLQTVTPEPHDPTRATVTETTIDYTAHTWHRTSREEPFKMARPHIIDPLSGSPDVGRFSLLGTVRVDGRQTYHLRSTDASNGPKTRLDIWLSTDQAYLIRLTRTTEAGTVFQRVDNRWLPRTQDNLALTTATIPSGFKQVFVA